MSTDTRERHKALHSSLDELLACYITSNPGARPSNTTVMELLKWSFNVSKVPGLCSGHKESETMVQVRELRVVRKSDGEVVHRVKISAGKTETQVARCKRGMEINLDHEHFKVVDSADVEAQAKASP